MTFLQQTANEIFAAHGNNMSYLTVVLPTHRACYFFRKALADKHETLWLPTITTLADWVAQISGLRQIDKLEEIALLHKAHLAMGRDESLDEFIPLGRTLCNDFEEMDMHLVRTDWFFRELRNLASMKVYEPATELSATQVDYLKFWERFENLYKEHRKHLQELKLGNSGIMFRKVADEIETVAQHLTDFYFIGFDGLTKAEESIIKHLHTHAKATVFWDADTYYVKHPTREAGYFFRKYFDAWKGNMKYCENQILNGKKEIEIISVARSVGQAKVAVEIIVNKLKLEEKTAINTAVILPDEKLLQPMQYLLPASLGKYNLTMGLPVSRSLAGEFVMLLFRLHESAERVFTRSKKNKLYFKDLIPVLQHPFFAELADAKVTHDIIQRIRKGNIAFVTKSFFDKSYSDTFSHQLLGTLFHTQSSAEYLEMLRWLVNDLFFRLRSRENRNIDAEFLLKISDAVDTVALGISDETIQPKTIRALLNDEFKNHRVPFEGEPAEGLQIMGLMESRCLDFENVIILSTNEGVIPAGKSGKSYIPHPLRNASMFSHTQKDARTAYLFYRLLHKAKRIFLIYDTEGNNMGGGERSRFILQLQYELAKEAKDISIKESVYSVAPPAVHAPDSITVHKDEHVLEAIRANITFGLSPSALSAFINCSLQYYFRTIAKLREPEEVEENMESNTMGTAIHTVLEELYKPVVGKAVTVEWVDEIRKDEARITSLLKAAFTQRFDEDSLMQGKNHLQFRMSLKMIDSFLKNEAERIKNGAAVAIHDLEKELFAEVDVDDTKVKIRGFADRIEWQNNSLTIVDFKSGKAKSAELKVIKEVNQFDEVTLHPDFSVQFQLLTYALAYVKQFPETTLPIQSGIFWLQKTKGGFDNLTINGESLLTKNYLEAFEAQLKQLLAQLLDEEIPFAQTTDTKRCEYCAYKRICRR